MQLCRFLERSVRECCEIAIGDAVRHVDLLAALVAGLPAKKQAKALRRQGEKAPAEASAWEPAATVLETAHIWHGRMASHVHPSFESSLQVIVRYRHQTGSP